MNAGKPPSRDWRAQPPAQSVYAREWRGGPAEQKSRFSKKTKVRLLVLGIIAVIGLIGILLAPIADRVPQTQIVAFGIGSYGGRATPTGNMPVNPFGERDARAFSVLSEKFPDQFLPVRQEDNALSGAQLLSFLEQEAQSPAVNGRNLIVFCTLHALVQPSGNIELFAIDATPDSPSAAGGAMIPLDDVIARLRRSVARHVVLALDASRLQSAWRLGVLTNDVVAQAVSQWSGATTPGAGSTPVTILLAAGPGESSWPAEGQSEFVTALIAGLSGEADGSDSATGGAKDRRVTLHELAAFLRTRTTADVVARFGAPQTVQLIGDNSDVPLAIVAEPRKAPAADSKKEKEKEKPAAAAVADVKSTEKPAEPAKEPATPPPPKTPKFNWESRLAEIRATRDALRDSGRDGLIRRRMPFTWRALDAQLELAEALIEGGQSDLAPEVVQRADVLEKSLLSAPGRSISSVAAADVDAARRTLGFAPAATPPTREALAAAGKFLQGLAAPVPANAPPPAPPPAEQIPDAATIQTWLRQQLLNDPNSRSWGELKKIVARLDEMGTLPPTVESLLIRDVLQAEGGDARLGAGNSLSRLFALRDRCRRLAVERMTALPLIQNDVTAALHALTAAERWMFIVGSDRSEPKQWLDQAEQAITRSEATARQHVDTLTVWTDLLIELPDHATWIAARANDDPHRNSAIESLRSVASRWAESERSGNWDASSIVGLWPDRSARWTDLERKLLTLLVDVQRLKVALLPRKGQAAQDSGSIPYLLSEIAVHRRDFQDELARTIPRLGTADKPTPQLRLEAQRLLAYSWLSTSDRKSLDALSKMTPQGDPLATRNPDLEGVCQGFWATATLSLLSQDPDDTAQLWKDWDRLAELSNRPSSSLTDSEEQALIRRRAELGRSIRLTWRKLQDRAGSMRSELSAAGWGLVAATLDPTQVPESDPDQRLLTEESRQLDGWLTLFATDWSQHRWNARFALAGAQAQSTAMWEQAGATVDRSPTTEPGLNEIAAPKFDPSRAAKLEVTASSQGSPLKIFLSGKQVRLQDQPGQSLAIQSVPRPASANGQWSVDLKLEGEADSSQNLLVVLTDAAGYPLDFRPVPLNPPFDPNTWRVELVESKTGAPLQTSPLPGAKGLKLFLPPMGDVALKANLIRPVRDTTPAAKLDILQIGESSRTPLAENIDLKLEPGKERTAILIDLPPPPATGEAKEKPAAPPGPLADLALGWVFVITPEGQQPIEYVIRPTFWSATKFINIPQPELRDDRFVVKVQRLALSKDDLLIPPKIPIELRLPPSLQNVVTDFTLGGPLGAGQTMTLSFTLPTDWRERARQNTWDIVLDVAGLPHAFRWRLDASGTLPLIGGQPPIVNPRLMLPAEPKAPPRLAPIVKHGQEPLHLLFEVDAATLDRTEGNGDWTLTYKVVRETEDGVEATPLQHSWRLFSSLERHVSLAGIQRGTWKLTTSANDYEVLEAKDEVRSLAGRFRVNATLTQADDPQRPAATAGLRFAIDDDAPPDLVIKGLSTDTRLNNLDLAFRIESADAESGIEKLVYGFDANADKMLQPEEIYETKRYIGFDNPSVVWPVIVPKAKLPKLEKDEETRQLVVQSTNSNGITATRAIPVTLKKPPVPVTKSKGKMAVNLDLSKGAKATIQITGPDARNEQTEKNSTTFSDLSPGQYTVTATVSYAVIGRREKGEVKVDVKAGETTTTSVPLSVTK